MTFDSIRRHYTYTVHGRRCHAGVETRWYSPEKRNNISGSMKVQTWDGDFVCEVWYQGSGKARINWLAYIPGGDFETFWSSGQRELADLVRAALQFFLRFFPECTEVQVDDYFHFDVGASYHEGGTNMYLSSLVALLEGEPSWFVFQGFPLTSTSQQEVSETRKALTDFLEKGAVDAGFFVQCTHAVWDSIRGIFDDLEKRCSQHTSWRAFLASFLAEGRGVTSMFPWLPCFAKSQREVHRVGTGVCLDAQVLLREPKIYVDAWGSEAEETDEDVEGVEGSSTPLLVPLLEDHGLQGVEGRPDRVILRNEMLYTMNLSWADVEGEDGE